MQQRFAVIGKPIAHSLSPLIHQHFAQQTKLALTYETINGDEQFFDRQVRDFFTAQGKGLNVTLPFKQRAFELAQQTTTRCKQAGAANTLWIKNQELWADNTDGIGFMRDVTRYVELAEKRILIVGAGGAVRGIISPLLDAKPACLVLANRTLERARRLQQVFPQIRISELAQLNEHYDVVVNATSASLDGQLISLPEQCFLQKPFCYDLAYQQGGLTPFVHHAISMGCDAVDGLGMLVEQAAEAFYIWHKIQPVTAPVLDFLRQS
ncbi:MAG: shikimate dehydrogenase [Legionellales bacterium]